MLPILRSLRQFFIPLVVSLVLVGCSSPPTLEYNPWKVVSLPTDATMIDVGFTGDPNHGWVVGNESSLLETFDGGDTWQAKSLDLDSDKYIFTSVSFVGDEGWAVGQPNILLHTTDGGALWEEVPLSDRLPGQPTTITALDVSSAEMSTDVGAIYRTVDSGQNWKAMVEGAVGVVRNIARSGDGRYVAVSGRGSFYSTWQLGQREWSNYNRENSKRLQNMGFAPDGRLWQIVRGGELRFGQTLNDTEAWGDPVLPDIVSSLGLLDMAYRTPEEIWVTGGSGVLLCSFDGGETWKKDKEVEEVPGNFYRVNFLNPEQGFVLGQNGILLKYEGGTELAA